MSPSARRSVSIAAAISALLLAFVVDRALSAGAAEERAQRAGDLAKEKVRALQATLKGEVERLLRTAGSAASLPALREVVTTDKGTLTDGMLNEAWWKEYRTPPMSSALHVGEEKWVRTSSEGPGDGELLELVKKADSAGRAELAWAGDRLWAVAAVRLPVVMPGDVPRDIVVSFARALDLSALPGAWVLTDGKMVLGRHGPEAELNPLLAAVGNEKKGTHPISNGVAAAVDLMPGLWLWAAEAASPGAGAGGLSFGLFGGAGLLAVLALVLGFRGGPEATTQPHEVPGGFDRTQLRMAAPDRTQLSMKSATDRYGEVPAASQASRYEVVAQLGEGGMARVFLAMVRGAEGFTRFFVLKRLRPELLGTPESVTQFIDEARLGSKLVHSNIVPVFDFGRDADGYYLAQEYIQGRDLDHLSRASVEQRRMPLETAAVLYVAREALRALAYLHTRTDDAGNAAGLVHRDVSPNNLMISARGEVKLLDLGIAKSEENLTRTQAGMVKGNVFYMSPEQARGEPVDARSDLYSLGLVIFTAATGDTMLAGNTNYELLMKSAQGLSAEDWQRVKALPPPLGALLEKALQPLPQDRFQTAEAFADAIPASAVGKASDVEALMQAFFAEAFKREQQTLQQATRGA